MNNLDRFKKAQEKAYETALFEIKNGHKVSHWMWYIFPQLKGLGMSAMSEFYGIDGLEEAKEYLNDEYLKNNLIEISECLLDLDDNIINILGYPDNYKLNSCMTLFDYVSNDIDVFKKVIDKFYNGEKNIKTLEMLKRSSK